jgi:hypothetical protein
MALQIKKATRNAVYVKIGMMGISGSGKTMSALLMGYGLLKAAHPNLTDEQVWEKILVIDTENGSASLYAGLTVGSTRIGEFLTIDVEAPFTVEKYIEAINAAEANGVEFLIIDSMSHAWQSEGGLLDKQNAVSRRMNGQTYQAWREITPLYNQLIDRILQCKMHVVSTYRGKKEYALEDGDNGKKKVTAKGVGAQFREGADYESTVYFEIAQDHMAFASKDRTHLFDGQYFLISPETGRQLYAWLSSADQAPAQVVKAVESAPVVAPAPEPDEPNAELANAIAMVDRIIKEKTKDMTVEEKAEVSNRIKDICGKKNYKNVTEIEKLRELYKAFAN